MAPYKIFWKKSALKELKKLDREIILRIIPVVENLSQNPFPAGIRKLAASEFTYRVRVGDYRIIYSLYEKELVVEIVKVGHRKDVYKK